MVVAAEPITDVDTTAADMLVELLDNLDQRGIGLSFAELKGPVKDTVERYGLDKRLAAPPFPSTVGEGVHEYLEAFDVPWEDWEDAAGRYDRARGRLIAGEVIAIGGLAIAGAGGYLMSQQISVGPVFVPHGAGVGFTWQEKR